MQDYVVQSGPLRSFEGIYDPRFEKLRLIADYHTIQIFSKPVTRRIVMAEIKRSAPRELRFAAGFFAPFAEGHRTIFGIRDVAGGKAGALASKLLKADLKFLHLQYAMSEDDLVLVEVKDFLRSLPMLEPFAPPVDGGLFFYLTSAPFDLFEIAWQRAAEASLKAREDRFRRDVLASSHDSKLALFGDRDGSFTVVLHPKNPEVQSIERQIELAGRRADMNIVFAPGLFG